MTSDLARAWRKNCDLGRMLLDAIPDAALADRYSERTRTVASQFAHLHNVRVYHVDKRAREHLGELATYPRGAQPARSELRSALDASGEAIARLLADAEKSGRVRSWKGPPASYLAYFVAHEAHHRGLILVALRLNDTRLPKSVTYGLWDGWRKA